MAFAEIGIGDDQRTVGIIDVANDKLISAIIELVNQGMSAACIKVSDSFAFFLGIRSGTVIYGKVE